MPKLVKLTDGQLVQLVELVEKARKRIPDEIKKKYQGTGTTWFTERDRYIFQHAMYPEASGHSAETCEVCEGYDGDVFRGDQVKQEFPWCKVFDHNFIYPSVHPHCRCALIRLFTLDQYENEYVETITVGEETMVFRDAGRPEGGYTQELRTTENVFIDVDRNIELHGIMGYEALDAEFDIRVDVLAVINNNDLDSEAIEDLMDNEDVDFEAMVQSMFFVSYITQNLLEDLKAYKEYRNIHVGLASDVVMDWMTWRRLYRIRKNKKKIQLIN